MPRLIFDIETISENFDELDENTKSVLTHWIKKTSSSDEEFEAALLDLKQGLGLSPLTGEIVSLAVLDYEKSKGVIYFQAPGENFKDFEQNNFKYKQMTEKEMLENFWNGAQNYDEFITFNGRSFDVPFLMIRSAVHKIRPTKDLMSNRYLSSQKWSSKHIDLLDQLSFYGALRRKGGLHLWCRAFGIKSPKADGISGDDVSRLFQEKKFKEIAMYNANDVLATKELFEIWEKFIKF